MMKGEIVNKRYQIFISSTYEDLKEERQKVTQTILKLYHFPIGMEMFHADNEEQWIQIKNTIDMSDYYIVIIGRYCGTLISKEGISYTEKEYNYAISKGVPVLSFIISDKAKKESYGQETSKQQRALKKFIEKVKKLPCEFWMNADDLAYRVSTTLSMKFQENNRNGWMPYNPYGINLDKKISEQYCGEYNLIYFSELADGDDVVIRSKLFIKQNGEVSFFNNIKGELGNSEYIYHGMCEIPDNMIYIVLKNESSDERATICLIKPAGNLRRLIGLLMAATSDLIPVCIKIVCIKKELLEGNKKINFDLLKEILTSENVNWKNNMLTIEGKQKQLFYSDAIFNKKDR